MFRIATLYGDVASCGRNDGGPLYSSYSLKKIFGKENVVHILPMGDWDKFGHFDYYWMTDWGEDALGYQNFEIPSPSVYIASDTHLGYSYRLSRAKRCSWIFCNQEQAVADFIRDGIPADRCFWLPHGFDPLAYNPGVFNEQKNCFDTEAVPLKRYDVCFIGHLNDENRATHLDRLFKEFPDFYWGNQRFHLAAEKFNQSKIVFNVSAKKELNMRVFESLGTKSFLLTDNIPNDQNVFKEGVHFIGYDNLDDMITKAHYYLEHDAEREAIAEAGYLEAISKHTYMHRVFKVLDVVGIPYDKKALDLLPKAEIAEAVS